MRKHGQEAVFGAVGFLGFVFCMLQDDLGVLPFRDFQHCPDETRYLPGRIEQGLAALRDPAFPAVYNSDRAILDIETSGAARLAHARYGVVDDVAVVGMDAGEVRL